MLTRELVLKTLFDKVGFQEKPFNDHFMECGNAKKKIRPPTTDDGRAVESLEMFLIILYNSLQENVTYIAYVKHYYIIP